MGSAIPLTLRVDQPAKSTSPADDAIAHEHRQPSGTQAGSPLLRRTKPAKGGRARLVGVVLLRGFNLECARSPRRVTGQAVRFGGDEGDVAGVAAGDGVGDAVGDVDAAAKVEA